MLHECYNRFNEVEVELYKEVPVDLRSTMDCCVKACKDLIICNLHWSSGYRFYPKRRIASNWYMFQYRYGLKPYMDESMLQPDGRVVFPIKLPPPAPSVNSANGAVSTKPNTTISHREISCGTTPHKFTSGWSSIIHPSIVPVGLATVTVFAMETISVLYLADFKWLR